jgi:L,D-peptidoglycan transpeptidase YkuD (ErfK/YbiS/YcfS/YnhG family)
MTTYTAAASRARITGPDFDQPCGLGKGGVIAATKKHEGDGKSPIGSWVVRKGWYRPDRLLRPLSEIIFDPLGPRDGWCDDPNDIAYNRPVLRPYPASHEALWRDDGLYDLVIALGQNDDPPVAPLGSAIFLHCAKYDQDGAIKPTLGCVSIARTALESLVQHLCPGDVIEIAA